MGQHSRVSEPPLDMSERVGLRKSCGSFLVRNISGDAVREDERGVLTHHDFLVAH